MSRALLLLVGCSATLLVFGLWIPFKALVAQEMLELAWAESQARQSEARPWPWADTWPVAKLDIPEQGVSMIVLEGVHGESLAFGPGRVPGSEGPGAPVVLAGHRDTHFRHLQHLEPGDAVRLQGMDRQWRRYQVTATRVVDSSRESLDTRSLAQDTLVLITCYPFDSLDASGTLRYVVEAKPAYGMEQIDTVAAL
ncbi:MAG: class GN sortase [Marinobacter nauticus]|jgi:sortase A|uniref:class GN sortase n=1 Tax=Marinobacter sp. ST-43 TaxID=3050453 RepID=UPI000C5080D1|nr:class GN sortase [Marinobacter sp. ST-43]MAP31441.1 class GN sortase [Marinobacter sp.]MCS5561188.1 class GN sortase [Marinobacter nauticus]HCP19620.1 class GN sortase [Marinobacter nauticus]